MSISFAFFGFFDIILSIILIGLVLINSTKSSLVYTYYKLDPVGFIENLCENNDKPELQCNGKCQLKKVAESTSKDNEEPIRLIDFKEILLYNEKPFEYLFNKILIQKKTCFNYSNLYSYIKLQNCFHPPQF